MVGVRKCAGVAGRGLGIREYRLHRDYLAYDFRCRPANLFYATLSTAASTSALAAIHGVRRKMLGKKTGQILELV
jgi:hypothetical protein